MPDEVRYLRCKQGFMVGRTIVKGGQLVRADDPIVKGRESEFEPLDDEVIETATRAPGERRVTPRDRNALVAGKPDKPAPASKRIRRNG